MNEKQFNAILNESAMSVALSQIDDPGKHRETSETFARIAKEAPAVIQQEIWRLRNHIKILESYLK